MLTVLRNPGPASTLTLLSVTHGLPHVPHRNMTNVAPLHGAINILLGGVMMSGMLVVVFCICYCCHKRVQKTEFSAETSDQWLHSTDDPGSNMQIFMLDSSQVCYEEEGVFVEDSPRPSPPPSYFEVVTKGQEKEDTDPDLPSYDAALRLEKPPSEFCTIYMDQLTYI